MNREELLARILNKRVRDYSFPIGFFIIFSIFVFFAIRPNLVTAFSLQKELGELRLQDEEYERVILNIVSYQTIIEKTRDDLPMLKQAIPESPEIFTVVRDIKKGAAESDMTIDNLDISDISLKEGVSVPDPQNPQAKPIAKPLAGDDNKKYMIRFQVSSNFKELQTFLAKIIAQRRLKVIDKLDIVSGGQQGTQSATFNVSFVVDSYYL